MKKDFLNTITRKAGKVKLGLKKASPEILIVVGTVGVVVSAVMACKATLKVEEIVDGAKEDIKKVNEAIERGETEAGLTYTQEDKQRDMTILYSQTALDFVKLYGPSVLVGAVSIGCIIGSHNILRKRNIALAAAYATVDKAYKEYRGRVIEQFGEEVDRQLRFGAKKQTISETVKDENGEEKTVEKEVDVIDGAVNSPYSKFFDESSRCWEKDANYNLMFLRRMQSMFNDKLKANGYVFLNDVYDALDIERTPEGQTVGWVYDPENPELENYIDFGIYDVHRKSSRDFVNGLERVILLNFNVDGNILQSFKSYEVK